MSSVHTRWGLRLRPLLLWTPPQRGAIDTRPPAARAKECNGRYKGGCRPSADSAASPHYQAAASS